jgi:hypothetical protein
MEIKAVTAVTKDKTYFPEALTMQEETTLAQKLYRCLGIKRDAKQRELLNISAISLGSQCRRFFCRPWRFIVAMRVISC